MGRGNLVIDGTQLLMASLAVNDNDYTNEHEYLGGLTGLLGQIAGLIIMFDPSHVYVSFDTCKSEYRLGLLPEYKGGRAEKVIDEALKERFAHRYTHTSYLTTILPMLGINVMTCDGVEADDILANFVKKSKRFCTLVSTDKDFIQLVSDDVRLYRPIRNPVMVTKDTVEQVMGTDPATYLKCRFLEGDVSDNIKGVKGIGQKTAMKIFKLAGSSDPYDLLPWAKSSCKERYEQALVKKVKALKGVTCKNDMAEFVKNNLATVSKVSDKWNYRLHLINNFPEVNKELIIKLGDIKEEGLITFIENGNWELNEQLMDLNEGPDVDILASLTPVESNYDQAYDFLMELNVLDFMEDEDIHRMLINYEDIM